MVNTEKLIKLLQLTTSTYNGEALNAIRKANEEIKKEKVTWDDVLSNKRSDNDFANSLLIQSLRSQLNELRNDRDEYKRDYWIYKNKYDDIIRDRKEEQYQEKRKTGFHGSKQTDNRYDSYGNYIPRSKRR